MPAVPCKHWSDCGPKAGGCCAIGLYGSRPPRHVCLHVCKKRETGAGPQPPLPASPPRPPPTPHADPRDWKTLGPKLWAELHTKLDADRAWLDDFTARIPCGECKAHWQKLLAETPPGFGEGFFAWGVNAHNAVNRRLGKPEITLEAARERWGVPAASTPVPKERIVLRHFLCQGDLVVLTALPMCLALAHPGHFEVGIEAYCMELFAHNPYVSKSVHRFLPGVKVIDLEYPLIHRSNQNLMHFLYGFLQDLEEKLGVKVPLAAPRGDVHLSEKEKEMPRQVEGDYWVLNAGYKHQDFTAKCWPTAYYQEVVNHFRGRINFVQVGESHHTHAPLEGVVNLIGKTKLREFVRLMYWAKGSLGPVSFHAHLAAAVPTERGTYDRPCVVIGGGREAPAWEAYHHHRYLHTVGSLPCCATGGCWKARVVPLGDGSDKDESLCERPVKVGSQDVARCMEIVRPADVIRAVESYHHEGGPLRYLDGSTHA